MTTNSLKALAELGEAERGTIKRKVMQHVHRSGMIKALGVRGAAGERPVIVAFEDETVGDVLERASWSGGAANLLVLMDVGSRIAVMALEPGSSTPSYAKVRAKQLQLQEDSHVGMLVHAAEQAGEALELAFGAEPDSKFEAPQFLEIDELIAA